MTTQLNRLIANGIAAAEQGNWPAAQAIAEYALIQSPQHPGALQILGLAHLNGGDGQQAITHLEMAAHLMKQDIAVKDHLARAYMLAGRYRDADKLYQQAIRMAPTYWPYTVSRAIALAEQGSTSEAIVLLKRLLTRYPDEPSILYNLGHVQRKHGHFSEAEHNYRAALTRAPDDVDIRLSLGSLLHSNLRFAEAEDCYRTCVIQVPDSAAPRLNLVSVLADVGRFEEAESECRKLLALTPDSAIAHRFLGASLGHQGRQSESLSVYRRAAELAPDDPLSLRTYGGALAESGQLHPALRLLSRAAELETDNLATAQLDSTVYLCHGLFQDGWSAYRQRPAYLGLSEKWAHAKLTQALPEDLERARVYVRREQGVGDELFFLRYLAELTSRCASVTVITSEKIASLVSRSDFKGEVLPESAAAPADSVDHILFCGDLPYGLHRTESCPVHFPAVHAPAMRDFPIIVRVFHPRPPAPVPLTALDDALSRMRERLTKAGPPPYIGLTWRAGTAAREQTTREWALAKEVPLSGFTGLFAGVCGTIVAVQRLPAYGELENLRKSMTVTVADFTAVNDNLEDMLALMTLIDEYVTVSNTNVHLRVSAGRAARVLVPNPAEWRWMNSGDESPWFPGCRIYRQSPDGGWQKAFTKLQRELALKTTAQLTESN
jgi:tetratricopeptide (TPR) repeat protein